VAGLTPNSAGEFEILDLGEGDYNVVVEGPGYQTFQQDIHFSFPDRTRIRLNVHLTPEAAASQLAGNAVAWYEEALVLSERRESGKAIELYRKVVRERPDFYPAWHNLGSELLRAGDAEGAEKAFRTALEQGGRTPETMYLLGVSLYNMDRFIEAVRYLRACETPENGERPAGFEYFLGMSYLRTGIPLLAEENLKRSLERDPEENSRAHLGLAWLYLESPFRQAEARFHLKAFLESHPDDPLAPRIREQLKQLSRGKAH
jgi:tetratricopeptide (TPR) repeat protein